MNKRRMLAVGVAVLLAACQTTGPQDRPRLAGPASPMPLRATAIALDPGDAARDRVGRLRYLGGLVLASDDRAFGELSALRWDAGTLVSVSDNAQRVRLQPIERDGRLVGARLLSIDLLLAPDGTPLTDDAESDSEALTRDGRGGWLVSFEGHHRFLRYRRLDGRPVEIQPSPLALFGSLGANEGVEALAGDRGVIFACAERAPRPDKPNCVESAAGRTRRWIAVAAPEPIARLGGVPTDTDSDSRGRRYVLFRSFSPADGAGAAVVRLERDGRVTPMAVLRPPLTLDNMEGLAVREERGRTLLYLVSDDNRSPHQRTLLMKFAVEEQAAPR